MGKEIFGKYFTDSIFFFAHYNLRGEKRRQKEKKKKEFLLGQTIQLFLCGQYGSAKIRSNGHLHLQKHRFYFHYNFMPI